MKSHFLLFGLIVLSSLLLAVTGCKDSSTNPYGGGGNSGGTPSGNTVTMGSSSFNPQNMTVKKGATVTWSNTSGIAHTSTSDNGVWDTGNIPAGGSKTTTFNTTGTFPYHCTYHQSMGMVGSITVQ